VTAGSRVILVSEQEAIEVKALNLSGLSNLLFRRNSTHGRIEALGRFGNPITLNDSLHS
jgi:2,3,4,5-tetrahydropyridine-2-carboxylate N-succinyltransferase